ncbi:MAG: hypothetical protein IJG33_14335 [Selenomonadaceae bacterium]|nr:hypothetical protein [Selenomonadaceae bacterium]MBQ6759132.1 hypothetical protein [Selenomonadaceae bacterium]MBR0102743.1 hypothetical protein [Selenomonadaceae bacterium]
MATVFYYLPNPPPPLTEEEKAELAALKDRPITYDEDCPPMTEEQLDELDYLMRKYKTRRITKEIKMKEFPERFQKHKSEAAG